MRTSAALALLLPIAAAFVPPIGKPLLRTPLRASGEDDPAALFAEAARLRAEADAVASTLPPPPAPVESKPLVAPITSAPPAARELDALPLDDAAGCRARLDALAESGSCALWAAAKERGLPKYAKTSEQRVYASTGIAAANLAPAEASDEDLQALSVVVFVGSAALALASGTLGGPLFFTWLMAAFPIFFIIIGSTAPGVFTQSISFVKGRSDPTYSARRARHEAAHFLTGYLLGVPVASCSAVGAVTEVELHAPAGAASPTAPVERDAIETLAVIALSGAVGEATQFGDAKGSGTGDLATLQALMNRAAPRIAPDEQVDLTRWGAVAAHALLQQNKPAYDALTQACASGAGVAECIATLERASRVDAPPVAVAAERAAAAESGGGFDPIGAVKKAIDDFGK